MNKTPAFAALLAVSMAACSDNPRPGQNGPEEGRLVWPSPPETPRIRYVGQIASDRDLGKEAGLFERIRNGILGTDQEALLAKRPFDTFVDENGRIYVTNGALSAILILDPDRKDADVLIPTGPGELAKPLGIDGDGAGTLFVADPVQRRVVALGYQGEFQGAYGGRDVLLNPVDVAVSPGGRRIYVADSYLHQVVVFARDGTLLRRVGRDVGSMKAVAEAPRATHALPDGFDHDGAQADNAPSDVTENRGARDGEFRYPSFVDVAPDGTVYVSDAANYRVQAFDADGGFRRVIGRHGDTPGSLARPKGVAVDSEGHLYVVDAAFNNVQIFDPDGRLLLAFGGVGTGAGGLWLPTGLSIDERDRIYVADRYNDRVQIFEYLPDRAGEDSRPAGASPVEAVESGGTGG